jgi:uncharacterized tannase-like protein DUF6351
VRNRSDRGRRGSRARRQALLGCAASLAAVAVALPPSAFGAPPEASTAGSGPVVAEADPFTLHAPGLRPGQIEMTTVSTRPTLVTGDDVRVEVRGLESDDALGVTRDGSDVTAVFADTGTPGVKQGVVTGLTPGPNDLVATATDATYGARSVTLRVLAHPIQGPVISGPHQTPFVCETVQAGMGSPTSADCDAPTQVNWWARVEGQFQKLSDPYAAYPTGTESTLAGGQVVPFVVRVESVVINRGIARIAVLDDPHARGPNAPFTPASWNRRQLHVFGESCGSGYHQGSNNETDVFGRPQDIGGENLAGPFMDLSGHLGSGWMVSLSTLTTLGVHCNPLLTAETMAMLKEWIQDDYGQITHVVSGGGSGGAIQQHTTANNYPGLLDAITPILSFPDVVTTAMTVADCIGMLPVFDADQNRWTELKQQAVTGLATSQVCNDWRDLFGARLNPRSCPGGVPDADRYDPVTNPTGVRCDLQDSGRNFYGTDPDTGFAYRPLENAGVQYGLQALRSGDITFDDFIELNTDIGGFDLDGNHTAQRHQMSAATAAKMYLAGGVTGTGALDQVPIIDQTIPVIDATPSADIHDQVRPFEVRARLDQTFGGHGNQAIWSGAPLPASAIDAAEDWLNQYDGLRAQNPNASRASLIVQAKPLLAGDQCRLGPAPGVPVACDEGLARHRGPRQQAGGPLAENIIKCQLKPVEASDYPGGITAAQLDQVRATFPDGVCDWTREPVGWTSRSTTWLTFGATQLAAEPVAVPYPIARSLLPGYARPQSATPARVTLVPAFEPCTSADGTHGAPLAVPSCNPPAQTSHYLTVGAPDVNGQPARSSGSVELTVLGESPIDTQNGDQADIRIRTSLTDVRKRSDQSDYTGELRAVLNLRITDRFNNVPNKVPATAQDAPLAFSIPCAATSGAEGASCSLTTTADALLADLAREGQRAIWELGQVQVYDGGADGDADTPADNTLFAVQGAFAP